MARWWRRGTSGSISSESISSGSIPAGSIPAPAPPARDSAPLPAPGSFARPLASWQNPSFLQPLGHAVDPAGPAGLINGLAVPAAQRTISGDADLPVATRVPAGSATVQRTAGPWPGFAASPVAVGTG